MEVQEALIQNVQYRQLQILRLQELYGILLDVIAHFRLAELYPVATRAIADVNKIYLEPEISLFKIMNEIKKCL